MLLRSCKVMAEVTKRVITQEDLDANPSFVEAGVSVGDECELEVQDDGTLKFVSNCGPKAEEAGEVGTADQAAE